MSIGLIVTIIVLIAVVLTLVVKDDDNDAVHTAAPAAPPAFTGERQGDGLVGGHDDAVVTSLQSHTGKYQGEGRVGGYVAEDTLLSTYEQAQRARDEMLFEEQNDPLGWMATPEQPVVMSREDMLFLEMNGVYDTRTLAGAPTAPTVLSFDRIQFLEDNVYLPGWTEETLPRSDRQRLTEF